MTKKQTLTFILSIMTSLVYSQNKKELNETINKLRLDSTALELTIKGNKLMIDSLKKEVFNSKDLNTVLHKKNQLQLQEFQKTEALVKEKQTLNILLNDSIKTLQKSLEFKISIEKIQIEQLNLRNDSLQNIINELKKEKLILTEEFSILNKRVDSLQQKITKLTNESNKSVDNYGNADNPEFYTIKEKDGYSNLREVPGGNVIKEVYEGEKFEIIGEKNDYKKVKFPGSSSGYIHNSRVINFNVKVCECLKAANEIIIKDLDKDFSTGSKTGFPDNWKPTYTERLLEIFRYNLSPKGCGFLADDTVIDLKSEIQRCSK